MIKKETCGRKHSCYNLRFFPAISWRYWGNPCKIQPQKSVCRPNLNKISPEYEPEYLTLEFTCLVCTVLNLLVEQNFVRD